jgi:hypothetical protein
MDTLTCFALVYQNGLANVFAPDGARILQGAFSTCEHFCRGLIYCGKRVEVFHRDVYGDCADLGWIRGKGSLYADQKNPPAQLNSDIASKQEATQ